MDAVLVEEGQHLVAEQLELLVAAEVGQPGGLDEAVGDVDAEAVGAEVEPEAQDGAELVLDGGVFPVEVGLLGGEEVQVPLAVRDAGPGGAAEDGLPVVGRLGAVGAPARAEVEALAQRGAGAFAQRLLEPFVLVGAVVGDEVHDDPQAQGMGFADHRVGVVQGAEHRVDGPVVGDVVARVGLRGGVERAEPDGVDAQFLEVGEPAPDAFEVPHPVPVAVGEAARIDLVDHRFSPPAGPGAGRGGKSVGEVLGHVVLEEIGPGVRGGRQGGQPWSRAAGRRSPEGGQPLVAPAVIPATR
ncbi:hypothetical protein EES37_02060 [Streptomyces sp. ADI91-18]|nr:hypothetical protein EES37_02060 [Streptomyces sp. ADI91-18]